MHCAWHGIARKAGRAPLDAVEYRALHGQVGQAGRVFGIQPQGLGELAPFILAHRGNAGDERALLAHDESLLQQRVGRDGELQVARGHFFAGGRDNDLLDPPQDADAATYDFGLVARAEPALRADGAGSVLGTVPVAFHDDGATHLQFAVLADAHFHTRQGAAHGGGVVVLQRVGADHGRRLGHAVALHQRQAQAQEAASDGGRQWRTAAHGHAHAPAELRQQRLGHE